MSWRTDILPPERKLGSKPVGLIVCGLGHMGLRGFLTSISLAPHLHEHGLHLFIAGIVEPNPRPTEIARSVCDALGIWPIFAQSLQQILEYYADHNIDTRNMIVYDASPSSKHLEHFMMCSNRQIVYFGEKPLVNHSAQLAILQFRQNFFCDFIDIANPAFLELKRYIDTNEICIEKARFWRHGSTAYKAMRGERTGVEGGALLDKAPHDIALTISLIGFDNIKGMEAEVEPWGNGTLMFADFDSVYWDPPRFFTTRMRDTTSAISPDVADASFDMCINWQVDDKFGKRLLKTEYSFSWIGVLPGLDEALSQYGFAHKDEEISRWRAGNTVPEWLGVDEEKSSFQLPGFRIEEARMCIIDGKLMTGKPITIIASFLPKLRNVPTVWLIDDTGQRDVLPSDLRIRFQDNSLARTLKKVVLATQTTGEKCELDARHSEMVHRIILDQVRKKAVSQSIEVDAMVNKSRDLFKRQIILNPWWAAVGDKPFGR